MRATSITPSELAARVLDEVREEQPLAAAGHLHRARVAATRDAARARLRRRRGTDGRPAAARSIGPCVGRRARGCIAGLAKSSVPVGREERDGVLEVVDDGLERRALAGQLGAVGRQPRADRLERVAEVGQLRVAAAGRR